jgi:Tfp pilus assembly protein PilE
MSVVSSPIRIGFTLMELTVVILIIAALAGIGIPTYSVIMNQTKASATRSLVSQVAVQIDQFPAKRYTWAKNVGGVTSTTTTSSGATVAVTYSGNAFAMKNARTRTDSNGSTSVNSSGAAISFDSIDGTPEPPAALKDSKINHYDTLIKDDGNKSLWRSGYRGFYDKAGGIIAERFVFDSSKSDNMNLGHHQIVDAWGEPLRIAYGSKIFGSRSFGVWSSGRNRTDDLTAIYVPSSTAKCDDIRSWMNEEDEVAETTTVTNR